MGFEASRDSKLHGLACPRLDFLLEYNECGDDVRTVRVDNQGDLTLLIAYQPRAKRGISPLSLTFATALKYSPALPLGGSSSSLLNAPT